MTTHKKQLERLLQEFETISYSISHPLKDPLKKSIICCQESLEENNKDQLKSAIEHISEAIDNINIIRQYLFLTTQKTSFERQDLSRIIKDILNKKQKIIDKRKVVINYDEMPKIYCNETQIKRLFSELIDNSIKFSKNSTETSIEILGNESNTYWTFIIKDNGVIIDLLYKNLIFQMFQKIDFKNIYEGKGIGLAFCKKIVENHEGSISYSHTNTGQNAFIIKIPKAI